MRFLRERVIIVGFKENYPFAFPDKNTNKVTLKEIIKKHEEVDEKFFASERIVKKRMEKVKGRNIPKPAIWHENKGGNIGIHEYSCALRAGASYNYLLVDGIRRLTPREQLSLQGYPSNFKIVVPDNQVRKLTGNSVPINMIRAVAIKMIETMSEKPLPEIIKVENGSSQTTFEEVEIY